MFFQSYISTHTPLTGRDGVNFNTSLSLAISTHTPLAGRDFAHSAQVKALVNFYSHAPRGARPLLLKFCDHRIIFLLTRPSRGATISIYSLLPNVHISTHTPLAGRDDNCIMLINFLLISTHTPLAGRDPLRFSAPLTYLHFYSHAPRGARPDRKSRRKRHRRISTHTPLAGRD